MYCLLQAELSLDGRDFNLRGGKDSLIKKIIIVFLSLGDVLYGFNTMQEYRRKSMNRTGSKKSWLFSETVLLGLFYCYS